MRPLWKWLLVLVVILVLLGTFGMPMMMAPFFAYGGYGMMPRWHMPRHFGYGGWPMMGGAFGWVGLVLSGLIQLGVLVLIVLGIVWLVRDIARQDQKNS